MLFRSRLQHAGDRRVIEQLLIERVVIEKLKELSQREDLINLMTQNANIELHKELPQIKAQRDALQKKIDEIKMQADGIMLKWSTIVTNENSLFLREKLDELAKERKDAEAGLQGLDLQIADIQREAIRKDDVTQALTKFASLFDNLQPYLKKEILRYVMKKAVLNPGGIKIALLGKPPDTGLFDDTASDSKIRCQTSIWLPR